MGEAAQPLRNENGLVSVLEKPKNAAYYEGADILAQAAILCIGISQAQAFLDGNKRTAFAVLGVFLSISGYRLPTFVDEAIILIGLSGQPVLMMTETR